MTSTRKIEANRKNARASTGPKTAQGRARLARNALRHGLSLPVCSDPVLCEEVESLADKIAGTEANVEIRDLARRAAEAQIDLRRVRYARPPNTGTICARQTRSKAYSPPSVIERCGRRNPWAPRHGGRSPRAP